MRLLRNMWWFLLFVVLLTIGSVGVLIGATLVLMSFEAIYLDLTIGNPRDVIYSLVLIAGGTAIFMSAFWVGVASIEKCLLRIGGR